MLQAHYRACGLTARIHGNTKRLPHKALSFDETRKVSRFLKSYAEANAILLPGRIPGYKRDDLQLLPSSTTKKVINNNLIRCFDASLHNEYHYDVIMLKQHKKLPCDYLV